MAEAAASSSERRRPPLLVLEPGSVWQIVGTGVDLFIVALREGRCHGARQHLCRLTEGVLIGLPHLPLVAEDCQGVDDAQLGAVAVPLPGGSLRLKGSLAEAKPEPAEWQAWLQHLTASLPLPPADCLAWECDPGMTLGVGAGARLVTRRGGVTWLTTPDAALHYLGRPEALFAPGEPLPLSGAAFARTAGPAALTGLNHDQLPTGAEGLAALERVHRAVMALLVEAYGAEQRAMQARFEQKRALTQACMSGALENLSAATSGQAALMAIPTSPHPLIAACALAAQAVGLERLSASLPPAPSAPGTSSGAAPNSSTNTMMAQVLSLFAVEKLPARQVLLHHGWWLAEGPPMVVGLGAEGAPMAALPSRKGYRIADPREGCRSTRPIDAALGARLTGPAVCLYRRLPGHGLKLRDLVATAGHGTSRDLSAMAAAAMMGGLVALVPPVALDTLVSSAVPHSDAYQLELAVAGMALAALAALTFGMVEAIALLRFTARVDWHLQSSLFDRLLRLPATFFRDYTAGDLTDRVLAVETARSILTGHTITGLLGFIASFTSLGLMFVYRADLAVLALGLALVPVAVLALACGCSLSLRRREADVRGEEKGLILQLLSGIAKLRTAAAETRAFGIWAGLFAASKRAGVTADRLAGWSSVFTLSYPILASAMLFAAVRNGTSLPDGGMTTGAFLAFYTAFGSLVAGLPAATQAVVASLLVVPLVERAWPVVAAPVEGATGDGNPGLLTGDVELSGVCFRYKPDLPPVLDGLSLRAKAGEFLAIVGPSGSGKSSILRLLLGFERPEAGGVFYDGKALATLDVAAVRRQIGVVLQSGRIMAGSIFQNIAAGCQVSLDEVWEAARIAGLDGDIEQWPMGMHTMVTDGGGTLSGGQRQRLMIARAVVRRPRLLLLDEATSALDNRTQAVVTSALARLNATRIVIAHRLSTVRDADRILVLAGGKVVQSGPFEALASRPGLFAEIIARQLVDDRP